MKHNPLTRMKNWLMIYYQKMVQALKPKKQDFLQESHFKNSVIGVDMKKTSIDYKDESKSIENRDTYVADLSTGYCLPLLITCFTADESSDPNLRITHYPPSNALH